MVKIISTSEIILLVGLRVFFVIAITMIKHIAINENKNVCDLKKELTVMDFKLSCMAPKNKKNMIPTVVTNADCFQFLNGK
jgi:hypothetical protein